MAALILPPRYGRRSSQSSPADQFLGDDLPITNWAFRLSYGFEYSRFLETSRRKITGFSSYRSDTFDVSGPWARCPNADESIFTEDADVDRFSRASETYDGFLSVGRPSHPILTLVKLPIIHVAGGDPEDFNGPQKIYELDGAARFRSGAINFVAGPL